MKPIWTGVTAVALLAILAMPAFANTETVTGQLVDTACYSKDKANTGNEHKGMGATCAQDCAKKGTPVALLTSDGKLYQVGGGLAASNNAKLVPHMSHTVEITGDVTEKDGKTMIAANDVKMIKK